MIELKTSDGYPIRFLIRRLNDIIGKDSILIKTVYTINTPNEGVYYTTDTYNLGQYITVYKDVNCIENGMSAKCIGADRVHIDNRILGSFNTINPIYIGADLLATEAGVVEYVELKTADLQEQIDNIGSDESKADKVIGATNGHLATLTADGNLMDSHFTIGSHDQLSSSPGSVATEKAVFDAIQEIKNNSSVIVEEWGANHNLNDYTETGIYHFQGYKISPYDNLPIQTYGNNINIAFTLIVDFEKGKLEGSTHIPGHVSQTLFLGNREGSETKIYVRNATIFHDGLPTKWEVWKELVSSVYLGLLDSIDGETINKVTEIGLYTGAIVNTEKSNFDVFKLEVINNYSIANLIQQTNHVLQTITVLSIDGSEKTLKRTGIYNGNGYTWNDWKSINEDVQVDKITIEETMDDLITLDFIDVIQNGDDIITDENNLILTI